MIPAANDQVEEIRYTARYPRFHRKQRQFVVSTAKRKMIRAGRRGGKTVGSGGKAVISFQKGRRVLYGAPTSDQLNRFWVTINKILREPIDAGIFYVNKTEHIIEVPGTENRIRAKTCWNADTLRGDYADDLILDEFQLMAEDTWELIGVPMLLDNDGDATFIYTPPALGSRVQSKASDPRYAAKMFAKYKARMLAGNPRYAAFHFSSYDNPYISRKALAEITEDMTPLAIRMEIDAEDVDEAPGALWTNAVIERNRVTKAPEDLDMVVVGLDPSATSEGDEAGIVGAGRRRVHNESYILADKSTQGSPLVWGTAAVELFHEIQADYIIAESNNGGEMVETVIHQIDPKVPVKLVHASRGKQTRAQPCATSYEKDRTHHVGSYPYLESEMTLWVPGDPSPNRMDALVWAWTALAEGMNKPTWSRPRSYRG